MKRIQKRRTKMNDYMTLNEAYRKADDVDYLIEPETGREFQKKDINNISISGFAAKSDQWKIIPAQLEFDEK